MHSAPSSRVTMTGSFTLPCPPMTAIPLFTPEGERAWVRGWEPAYQSGATDEVGAVWTTSTHDAATTWVTVIRNDNHLAYARVSDDGTAGLVSVRCLPADGGTRVHVTYDLTATSDAGLVRLQHFASHYDETLRNWHDLTARLLN